MNYAFLTFNYRNGQACPVFRCASCDEWINVVRDEKGGLILWDGHAAREGWSATPLFAVHRGDCLHRFEAARKKRFAWQDIDHFLANVLSNTRLRASCWRRVDR